MGTIRRIVFLINDIADGQVASGNTPRNTGLGEMLTRIGLFMLFLLIFVFVCAYAWRNIPYLKALIPGPKPIAPEEKPAPRLASLRPLLSVEPKPGEPKVLVENPLEMQTYRTMRPSDPLGDALASGETGSVIHAASDLDNSAPHSSIIIFQREDSDPQS